MTKTRLVKQLSPEERREYDRAAQQRYRDSLETDPEKKAKYLERARANDLAVRAKRKAGLLTR
jgi:hypothetical protein